MPLARDAEGNDNLKGENFERGVAGIGKLDPEMYRSISLDRWRHCKQSRLNELNEHYLLAFFGKEESKEASWWKKYDIVGFLG